MDTSEPFKARLAELCEVGRSHFYVDGNGARIDVCIQPHAVLERINRNPSTVNKLNKNGVFGCWVIGNDEFGLPLVMSLHDNKTYLLESDELDRNEYLESEVVIVTDR